MKKLFTILVFTVGAVCFGQSLPIDFDDASDAGFTVAGGAAFTGAVDGADNVGQIVGGTDQWDSRVDLALDTWIDMTTAAKTFTFDFHTSEAVVMTGLLQISNEKSGGFPIEMQFTTDGNIGWETITLDFTSATNGYPNAADPVVYGEYATISLFTNFGDTGTSTYMFDDLAGAANGGTVETCSDGVLNNGETAIDCGGANCSPCSAAPTTAAPTPPARNATDVISLYSDAYTDVASNFDAGWCGSNSIAEVTIAGNATQAFRSNPCQGIVLNDGIDASTFTNLHVDVYIEAGTDVTSSVFNVKFVQQPGGAALEVNFNAASSPALVAGSWVSIDVPVNLSAFTGFKEFGITSNLHNKVWYDNLYAYKGTALSIGDLSNAGIVAYPNPVKNSLNINAATTIDAINIYDITGREVLRATPNAEKTSLDVSSLNKGFYLLTIKSGNQELSTKLVK